METGKRGSKERKAEGWTGGIRQGSQRLAQYVAATCYAIQGGPPKSEATIRLKTHIFCLHFQNA